MASRASRLNLVPRSVPPNPHRGLTGGPVAFGLVADPIFADPRLAQIYDALDADRSDLDLYLGLVGEQRCTSESGLRVLDVRDAPDRPGLELVFVCSRDADVQDRKSTRLNSRH